MNKRQRDILAALAPAHEFAMEQARSAPKLDKVPGLALHRRVSAESTAELYIYGTIGTSWFGEATSAADVADALAEAGPGPLNVRINSGGGDVFQGVAIHTLLARHSGTVTVHIDGLAASAASFIMLAGDHIVSARNAMVMIHNGMTGTYGNKETHARAIELLGKVDGNIADMYAERAGEDVEYWADKMTVNGEDGTWYTGTEALAAGLVDELTAVKDDTDLDTENRAVAARLAGWSERLDRRALTFLAEHPADDPQPVQEPVDDVQGTEDLDFRFAMSMAHWLTTDGRMAGRKEAA